MKQGIIRLLQVNVVCSMAFAAGAAAQAVTLDEVLQDVVATNPRILEKQKAYNIAVAEQKDVKSQYLPRVLFTGNVGYKIYRDGEVRDGENVYDEVTGRDITGYTVKDDGFYDARITLSQLLFDFGKTSALVEARRNYMLAAFYSYVGEASQVSYEAIAGYLDVLKFNELRQLAMDNVLTHQNLLESVRKQVESGKKGRSDLERINGRMTSAQSRLLMRQNDYKKAVYALHKMLGRFTPVQEMVMPDLDTGELPGSLKEALALQVESHPLLREAYYNVAQKQSEHRNKRQGSLGRLSMEGAASVENEFGTSDEYETDARIGLRFELPLFDAGVKERVVAAAAGIHREQQRRYQVRRTLVNDIQMSWAAHKLLTEQIAILKKNLYFTGKSLETYKQEFVLGKRNLINILDAQNENFYIHEQLVDATYSREREKYRILLSEGVLLSRLGLLDSRVQAMIAGDDRYEPLGDDTLPLVDDFDLDGVLDESDISVNNLPEVTVDELGIDKEYDSGYIYDKADSKAADEDVVVIGLEDSLEEKPMRVNTVTMFDFDAFLPKGTGLTEIMTSKMMKDLVSQARTSMAGSPLFITVSTNEYKDPAANYSLGLQRAYTLKRILQKNRIEDKGIFVYADNRAAKGHNTLRLKFTDSLDDYQKQYEIHSLVANIFAFGSSTLKKGEHLDKVVAAIAKNPGKAEIILYSNETAGSRREHELGLQRTASLKKYLAGQGLGSDKVTVFSWGRFREDPLLSESKRVTQFLQYVLR